MALKEVSSKKSFGGWQKVFEHESEECKCLMKFGVFFPPQVSLFVPPQFHDYLNI